MQIVYDDNQACTRPDQILDIDNVELKQVSEIRDLGVTLDAKLTFAPPPPRHVSNIVSRANRALGLLIHSFQTGAGTSRFSRSAILAVYLANVR